MTATTTSRSQACPGSLVKRSCQSRVIACAGKRRGASPITGPETIHLPAGYVPIFAPLRRFTRTDLDRPLTAFLRDELTRTPEGRRRARNIDALLEHVTVLPGEAAPAPAEGAALSGKSFVFTGTLEAFTREVAQARVQALGGEVPSGVTKSLTYLVVGAGRGAKSSKQKKAEDLIAAGAPLQILGEVEFLALVGSLE